MIFCNSIIARRKGDLRRCVYTGSQQHNSWNPQFKTPLKEGFSNVAKHWFIRLMTSACSCALTYSIRKSPTQCHGSQWGVHVQQALPANHGEIEQGHRAASTDDVQWFYSTSPSNIVMHATLYIESRFSAYWIEFWCVLRALANKLFWFHFFFSKIRASTHPFLLVTVYLFAASVS